MFVEPEKLQFLAIANLKKQLRKKIFDYSILIAPLYDSNYDQAVDFNYNRKNELKTMRKDIDELKGKLYFLSYCTYNK